MEQGQSKEYEHNVRIGDLWRREYFAVDYTPYHGKMQIDWQSSSATLRTEDGNEVTFYRIEVALEDLLTLLPEGLPSESPPATALQPPVPKVAPARSKGLKRGPQGYSEQELKRFEVKFYELLYDDGVKAGAAIPNDHYAEDLMDWGKRNELRTPGRTKMTGQIEKWWMTWLEYKSFNK